MSRAEDLAYWINERELVRLRRAAGLPKPWSDDPIFQGVRFTNVHREDDKVTRWLAQHWRGATTPVWRIALARMINYIPALEEIADAYDPKDIKQILYSRRMAGDKVFSSAYTITTCGKRMDKIDYVVDRVCAGVDKAQIDFSSCTAAYQDLMQVDGLGSFLAAQIVADLKNTKGHPLAQALDKASFSAPGPGSLKGLGEYYGYQVTAGGYPQAIAQAYDEVKPLLKEHVGFVDMQDFQNCLCEYSKLCRVRRGGHARNHYPGLGP